MTAFWMPTKSRMPQRPCSNSTRTVTANSPKKNSDRLDRRVVVDPVDLVDLVVLADLADLADPIGKVVPKARDVRGVLKNSNLLT